LVRLAEQDRGAEFRPADQATAQLTSRPIDRDFDHGAETDQPQSASVSAV
jgi:hypothetical protein